ncbi:calcium/proton exchanger [Dichomitus squalens LYAD-421 SS1]|uniref:calcium/proton exchanger n=1 Tax=Dichomitus squalens (strain LYAD-421) TaxID=732165 RepID=UPI00044121CF|nr:calcium/proton exchanger [Dichomitus squalens LYAD-421 SS1]EJF64654.1 calcium/proton exchanger [Dichomitus squalens LYAD-421 SS1]
MPPKPVGQAPPFWQGVKAIILGSWLNVLLVFIPISWACHFALSKSNEHDTLIFVFSFLAIIPLAKLLAFATDELSMRVGQTLAGLLNATLGNAVELIVAIIALVQCQLQVVQASLIGSILSNLLLVLGMCFFAGGTRFSEQGFGEDYSRPPLPLRATRNHTRSVRRTVVLAARVHSAGVVQLNSSLLIISVIAVLLPAAFHTAAGAQIPDGPEAKDILAVSHGAAIILLFIYGSYLVFQLFSHKDLYDDKNPDIFKSTKYQKRNRNAAANGDSTSADGSSVPLNRITSGSLAGSPPSSPSTGHQELPRNGDPESDPASQPTSEGEEEETPQMSVLLTIALLTVVTVVVAVTAEFLVDSINGLTASGHISKTFVGLILLPIVGNAAEHVTAVTVSVKDKLTLSLGVAVGSSIQIALFVIPFIVTLGWILGKPMSMLFDPFESIVLFLSVLVVNYVVQDGKSNWLEGMILMCLYVIVAVTFWYYPGVVDLAQLNTC